MKPLQTVGARLSLALAAVVLVALAVVYAVVVPSLERNLADAKLTQLAETVDALPPSAMADPTAIPGFIESADETTNARVLYLEPLGASGPPLRVVLDSRDERPTGDVARDRVAVRASETLRRQRGIVSREGDEFAEVAVPVAGGVLLFSAPLGETLANVQAVKRRLFLAGVLALAIALVLGYSAATVFARRLRRLERAAERIAGGDLDEPVRDGGSDEVGQLADAFERMRRQLAHLEHARREFVANASHELRTPIFSLGGFLELLASEELDDETRRDFLASMQEQVERLTRLTGDLLDLSRLDAGQLRVEREPVDLAAVAASLADEFTAVARASGHALEITPPGTQPFAMADPERVRQVGRALVENALRHTPPGTHIRIGAAAEDGSAALVVEDDGPGIPHEHAEHVFERFYRVDGGRASGSGLGLAIARELAEAMGGRLQLDSAGEPTSFRVVLNAAPREQGPAEDGSA